MADNKSIIMNEYNGTDYDTLYPRAHIDNIEGFTLANFIGGLPTFHVSNRAPVSGDGKNGDIWFIKE